MASPAPAPLNFPHPPRAVKADLNNLHGRLPYERLPNESKQAYEAFATYRDFGNQRSLVKVAGRLGKAPQLVHRWSSRWRWVDRCRLFDDEQLRAELHERQDAIKESRHRWQRTASQMYRVAVQRLVGDAASGVQAINPNLLGVEELRRWLETTAKLERLTLGEPDTIAEQQHRVVEPAQPVEVTQERIDNDLVVMLEKLGLAAFVDRRFLPAQPPDPEPEPRQLPGPREVVEGELLDPPEL